MARSFVLLDRDGTIIYDRHYLSDPEGVELLPGAAEGLRRLIDLGLGLVVVSNQSGVGRGYFDEASVQACNSRMAELLAPYGVTFEGMYWCPHTPEEECDCRKPEPGLIQRAARELDFDPAASFMVGDKIADMGVGRNAGAATILVRTGKGADHEARCRDLADFVEDDLRGVADRIASLLLARP
ncbi:D-glycero-alpha-D-manno-heptose-1,7-bisphosphate 7-phosphatase [Pseudodesulfovibrio sp.]|uniref:D-glycero-alpha-D-manno-heptose-1,7-bisphosphate 7-phosphatase n=1 Tax=unclassified Pseudodesulfovibrio TaxID=2661612 RepID=UPI003B001F1D